MDGACGRRPRFYAANGRHAAPPEMPSLIHLDDADVALLREGPPPIHPRSARFCCGSQSSAADTFFAQKDPPDDEPKALIGAPTEPDV
jgi:hypothetical protein